MFTTSQLIMVLVKIHVFQNIIQGEICEQTEDRDNKLTQTQYEVDQRLYPKKVCSCLRFDSVFARVFCVDSSKDCNDSLIGSNLVLMVLSSVENKFMLKESNSLK